MRSCQSCPTVWTILWQRRLKTEIFKREGNSCWDFLSREKKIQPFYLSIFVMLHCRAFDISLLVPSTATEWPFRSLFGRITISIRIQRNKLKRLSWSRCRRILSVLRDHWSFSKVPWNISLARFINSTEAFLDPMFNFSFKVSISS